MQIEASRSRNRKIVSGGVKCACEDQGLLALSIASPAAVLVSILSWPRHHSFLGTYISAFSVPCAEPWCVEVDESCVVSCLSVAWENELGHMISY